MTSLSFLRHPIRQRLHLCITATRCSSRRSGRLRPFKHRIGRILRIEPTDWRTILSLPLLRKASMSSTEKAMPVFSTLLFDLRHNIFQRIALPDQLRRAFEQQCQAPPPLCGNPPHAPFPRQQPLLQYRRCYSAAQPRGNHHAEHLAALMDNRLKDSDKIRNRGLCGCTDLLIRRNLGLQNFAILVRETLGIDFPANI